MLFEVVIMQGLSSCTSSQSYITKTYEVLQKLYK